MFGGGTGSPLKTNERQKRSGGGTVVSVLVGSKIRWNHSCASAKRWLLLRLTATITGMWYSSSQL